MINPLVATMSVRDMQPFKYWWEQITFVDKLLIKNYVHQEAHDIARKYFLEHKEYTHLIILAEDVLVTPDMVRLAIKDVEEYGFPVLCGYSNFDWKHDWVNISLRDLSKSYIQTAEQYGFINPYDIFKGKYNFPFQQVFFQGLSLAVIRRDIVERIPFRAYKEYYSPSNVKRFGVNKPLGMMFDLAFCIDCYKSNVPIICDLRLFVIHGGVTINLIDIRNKEKYVMFYGKDGAVHKIY